MNLFYVFVYQTVTINLDAYLLQIPAIFNVFAMINNGNQVIVEPLLYSTIYFSRSFIRRAQKKTQTFAPLFYCV